MSKNENNKTGGANTGAPNPPENESPEEMAVRVQREMDEAASKTGAQPKAPETVTRKTNPPADKKAAEQPLKFFVSAGKSITSKKGILGPHTEVKPEYINLPEADRVKHLNALAEKGTLYKDVKSRPKQQGDNEVKSAAVVERPRKTTRAPRSE
jgi:hypothetical protein